MAGILPPAAWLRLHGNSTKCTLSSMNKVYTEYVEQEFGLAAK